MVCPLMEKQIPTEDLVAILAHPEVPDTYKAELLRHEGVPPILARALAPNCAEILYKSEKKDYDPAYVPI